MTYILDLVKKALGIDPNDTSRDEELTRWIEGSISFLAAYCRRPIQQQEITQLENGGCEEYILNYPTDAVTVEYREDGVWTEDTSIDYIVDYRSCFFYSSTRRGVRNMKIKYMTGWTLDDGLAGTGTLPTELYNVIVNYVVAVDKLQTTGGLTGIKSEKLSDYEITFKSESEVDSGNIALSNGDKLVLDQYVLYNVI